jgi:hypothetical protein
MNSDAFACHFGHSKFRSTYAPALLLGPVAALGGLYKQKHGGDTTGGNKPSEGQTRLRTSIANEMRNRPSGG